ncbi:MAG: hypothetical protein K8U57_12815, partial [Planctomycetes bacterium]|nr:hypothetical protein [Planctomycetota bacterium]
MKNKNTIMVRYTGADWMRTYLVQRGDCKFWDGERWTRIRDEAKVYHDHKSAQVAATALQSAQYKGNPATAEEQSIPIDTLLKQLHHCTDILPADYCDQLDLPKGST